MKSFVKNATKYVISIGITAAATAVWVQAWNGLTASNGDTLDATKWNQLVSTVQSGRIPGEVQAFNLASCPTGWSEYTAARGKVVLWAGDDGAGTTYALGATGGDKSAPAISLDASSLVLNASTGGTFTTIPTDASLGTYAGTQKIYSDAAASIAMKAGSISGTLTGGGTAPDNMQPYVALLYCVKD